MFPWALGRPPTKTWEELLDWVHQGSGSSDCLGKFSRILFPLTSRILLSIVWSMGSRSVLGLGYFSDVCKSLQVVDSIIPLLVASQLEEWEPLLEPFTSGTHFPTWIWELGNTEPLCTIQVPVPEIPIWWWWCLNRIGFLHCFELLAKLLLVMYTANRVGLRSKAWRQGYTWV